jgi:putative oxidoreductase
MLFVLAPVLANVLVFQITMLPAGLPLPLIVTALWIVVALQFRLILVPLFVRHAQPDASDRGFVRR